MARTTRERMTEAQVIKTYKTKPNEFDLIGDPVTRPADVRALTDGARIIRRMDWYAAYTHLVKLTDGREALVRIER